MSRRLVAAVAGVLVMVVGGLVPSSPVSAHASLLSTNPVPDSVLAVGPDEVAMTFDESVAVELAGIRVFGPDGGRVDRGTTSTIDGGTTAVVGVDTGRVGTYTVAWRVVSGDSHVLSGSFLFHVETRTGATDLPDDSRPALEAAGWGARWLLLTGTIVLGGLAALSLVTGAGRLDPPSARRVAGASAAAITIGAFVRLVVQVADTSGRTLWDALPLVPDAVSGTRTGQLDALRVAVGAVGVAAAVVWRSRIGPIIAVSATLAVMVSLSLSGHAWTADPRPPAVLADIVHQSAAAAWVGGLAAVALVAAHTRGPAGAVVERFSVIAVWAVGALVASGIASAWMQAGGEARTLWSSRYGAVLAVKTTLAAGMIAYGWYQRERLVATVDRDGRLFRHSRAELGIGVLVLAATATLVDTVPAREYATPDPFNATVTDDAGDVLVTVDPARPGNNVIHLYFFDDAGAPRTVDVAQASVTQADLPPRTIELTAFTAGHWTSSNLDLPTPGAWDITLVSLSRGAPATVTFEVIIQ